MRTPEDVEPILRDAMTKARAEGVRITQGALVQVVDGVTCACALGCVVLDAVGQERRLTLVMKGRLNITDAQVYKFTEGFDDTRSPDGPRRASKWRDLGEKLRLEFKPAPDPAQVP